MKSRKLMWHIHWHVHTQLRTHTQHTHTNTQNSRVAVRACLDAVAQVDVTHISTRTRTHTYTYTHNTHVHTHTQNSRVAAHMSWWSRASNWQVSFAKEPYKSDYILQNILTGRAWTRRTSLSLTCVQWRTCVTDKKEPKYSLGPKYPNDPLSPF